MKVSINLAQYYSNVNLKQLSIDELLKKIGAQLGAVEDVIDYGKRYEGIVVAKVVACEKHPNADKLSICVIDDGGVVKEVKRNKDGLVQVVCGAPNVRAGLTVAWLPPGVVVPSTIDKDPFKLEVREIRGLESNGMLASPAELAISDNHDGILEIKSDDVGDELVKPGTEFKKLYGLDDIVIDCENKMFTHRPDCFGNLGVARELAGIQHLAFKSPDRYLLEPKFTSFNENKLKLEVKVDTKLVSRFMAVALTDIVVGPSPIYMQAALNRIGIRPINNIVDVTNFMMHLTGQPLHAYDYDKVMKLSGKYPILVARTAKPEEKVDLLNGKEIELEDKDIVIATDKIAIGLGGVMGGSDTEVDQSTTSIILEAATFDMYNIRRTSMHHGLFTDAVTRFNKGQSPRQNDRVIAWAMDMLAHLAGAKQASEIKDYKQNDKNLWQPQKVNVSAEFINDRLGLNFATENIKTLLENVEFQVKTKDNKLEVTAPFWRTDIEFPEDIVEEVGRLYGYDRLYVDLPLKKMNPTERSEILDLKQLVREKLSTSGANEVLTYSFVHGDLLRKSGIDPDKWAYHVRNAMSPDLQYYRPSILPSLLEKVHNNIKSDMVRTDDNEFAIFEIGKTHVKNHNDTDDLPMEFERVALVFAADQKTADKKYSGSPYFQVKYYLEVLIGDDVVFESLDANEYPVTSVFQMGRSAKVLINGEVCGVIGEFRSEVKSVLKLPEFCAGFEIDTKYLKDKNNNRYRLIGNFPKVLSDLTFEVENEVSYKEVNDNIVNVLENGRYEHGYHYILRPRDIFKEKESAKKRLTFRVWLNHYERTLTTDEINSFLDILAEKLGEACGAVRV